jgi:hypothetical protein
MFYTAVLEVAKAIDMPMVEHQFLMVACNMSKRRALTLTRLTLAHLGLDQPGSRRATGRHQRAPVRAAR